ncbi:hypothetical protein MUK42_23129 [Musa troglodytarum]|uniref:Uncharacterized protein n=1 Tax=Musa troglodytarum TaxID=320322 RepID=A0A9E7GEH1_9LILI|nr:hypothetical protein MUK42_23129 [Musa troglodytarum]
MEEEPENGRPHPRLEEDYRRHGQEHHRLQKRRRQLPAGSGDKDEEKSDPEEASAGGGHDISMPACMDCHEMTGRPVFICHDACQHLSLDDGHLLPTFLVWGRWSDAFEDDKL